MKPWTTGVRRGAPRSALFGVVVQFETKATRHIWKLLRAHSARIDPNCIEAAKYFPNAEFIAGRSQEKLPGALRTIEERGLKLEFVLIDGDHGEDGVRGDIDCILKYKPKTPCYILMHDSFNPFCREGMLSAASWEQCPYVHGAISPLHSPGQIFLTPPRVEILLLSFRPGAHMREAQSFKPGRSCRPTPRAQLLSPPDDAGPHAPRVDRSSSLPPAGPETPVASPHLSPRRNVDDLSSLLFLPSTRSGHPIDFAHLPQPSTPSPPPSLLPYSPAEILSSRR